MDKTLNCVVCEGDYDASTMAEAEEGNYFCDSDNADRCYAAWSMNTFEVEATEKEKAMAKVIAHLMDLSYL